MKASLIARRQALDADLLAHRLGARGELARVDQLHRTPRAGVVACGARLVLAQAPLGIGRPAAVERAVGAAQQVDERGQSRGANRTPRMPASPSESEALEWDR